LIITFANQKGGVGKTTTTLNLGVYLAMTGKKVCLIDLDPQSNLTSGLGYSQNEPNSKSKTIYDVLIENTNPPEVIVQTRIKNLCLLPANISLASAEIELVNTIARETVLRNSLEALRDRFDYILIDCPPSLGLLTINALTASDQVMVPVQTEYFALEGLGQLLNSINLVKSKLNSGLQIGGVILTMYDTRTNLSKQVTDEVKRVFGKKVYKTIIPRNIKLSEAPSHGKSIEEYDPRSTGANAYKELAEEILAPSKQD
jgi:chromosome partitioning protein